MIFLKWPISLFLDTVSLNLYLYPIAKKLNFSLAIKKMLNNTILFSLCQESEFNICKRGKGQNKIGFTMV